ncbi:MAG: SAP domain-containing protein [Methanobacteriota archaeon]
MSDIKKRAKELGMKVKGGMDKTELIKSIQLAEGNIDCFGTAKDFCDQLNCAWREDCLEH